MNTPIRIDETFCGNVPLNVTNVIQPHGYLLIVEKKSLNILQVSENVETLTGRKPEEMIRSTLADFLPAIEVKQFQDRINKTPEAKRPFIFTFLTGSHLCHIKAEQDYYVIEIEKEPTGTEAHESLLNIYQELTEMMAALENTQSPEEVCDIAIRELKRISGFDKIMIYRFDEHWNGDVIAEIMEAGMESYLGLKFPASDIPKQARDLYRIMPYRLIPDVGYKPVKLYPVLNPLTHSFTDLTYSNLRSVTGVHLEYLRNMNVQASMSTRIMVNNTLWGLIACHHRTPKFLPFKICALFELFSAYISSRFNTVLLKEKLAFRENKLQLQQTVISDLYKNNLNVTLTGDWLKLLGADGIVYSDNFGISVFGETPARHEIEFLLLWLQTLDIQKIYIQENLSAVYQPAEHFSESGSGLMVIPVEPGKNRYLLAFRPEEIRQVKWAGKPDEAVHFESDGKKYHPRASFKMWQQNLIQTAIPWTRAERDVAEEFLNILTDIDSLNPTPLS